MTHAQSEYNSQVAEMFRERLQKTNSGQPRDTLFNAAQYLKNHEDLQGLLSIDLFANRIIKRRWPPWSSDSDEWTETDTVLLRHFLTVKENVEFSIQNLEHGVIAVAKDDAVHPVRDYLQALEWDGKFRVPLWLGVYLGAGANRNEDHRNYIDAVGKMFLVGAVARVMAPGCKHDNVLVLEGHQGLGKSTALAILAGEWFHDSTFEMGEKDAYQALAGVWICELAELSALSSVNESRAKAFFSSSVDRYRPPYARNVQTFKRQTVFAGTTNDREYLKDATGNRRYWPVWCNRLERDALIEDRNQLWAEAFSMWEGNFPNFLSADDPLWSVFLHEQQERSIVDPWEHALMYYTSDKTLATGGVFTLHELLEQGIGVDQNRMDQRQMSMRVAKIMRTLGYEKRQASTSEERRVSRYFYVKHDQPPGAS